MRRLALPLIVLVSALCASAALASSHVSAPRSALFSLRIDVDSSGDHTWVSGTGQIDGVHQLSSYAFTDTHGSRVSAVVAASPQFAVYLRNATQPHSPWQMLELSDTAPLMDPSLALRLGADRRRALGTEQTDGVPTTKYAMTIAYPEAALLAPTFIRIGSAAGIPVTVWIDRSGSVRRLHAVLRVPSTVITIDERLSSFGVPVQVTRPAVAGEAPHLANPAEDVLRVAQPDIESYGADHHGYVGMTANRIRNEINLAFPDVDVVRASAKSYCVQATVGGFTAHQDGPKAPYAPGRC